MLYHLVDPEIVVCLWSYKDKVLIGRSNRKLLGYCMSILKDYNALISHNSFETVQVMTFNVLVLNVYYSCIVFKHILFQILP